MNDFTALVTERQLAGFKTPLTALAVFCAAVIIITAVLVAIELRKRKNDK